MNINIFYKCSFMVIIWGRLWCLCNCCCTLLLTYICWIVFPSCHPFFIHVHVCIYQLPGIPVILQIWNRKKFWLFSVILKRSDSLLEYSFYVSYVKPLLPELPPGWSLCYIAFIHWPLFYCCWYMYLALTTIMKGQ